jgi:hypothetical protein
VVGPLFRFDAPTGDHVMQLTQHLRLCSSFRCLFAVATAFAAAAGPAAQAHAAAPVASGGKIVKASMTL